MGDGLIIPRVVIARPLDPDHHIVTNEVTGWVGNVYPFLDPNLGAPGILGLKLRDSFWSLDANIERWWGLWTEQERGRTHVVERWPDVEEWTWVYVGTARNLIILTSEPQWMIGSARWDEPVQFVEFMEIE